MRMCRRHMHRLVLCSALVKLVCEVGLFESIQVQGQLVPVYFGEMVSEENQESREIVDPTAKSKKDLRTMIRHVTAEELGTSGAPQIKVQVSLEGWGGMAGQTQA